MLETKLLTFCTEYLYDMFDDIYSFRHDVVYSHASTRLFARQVEMSKEYLMNKTCRYGIKEYTIVHVTTYAGIIYCNIESETTNYNDVPLCLTELIK